MYHEVTRSNYTESPHLTIWQFVTIHDGFIKQRKSCTSDHSTTIKGWLQTDTSSQFLFLFFWIIIQNILKRTKQSKSWPDSFDKFMGYINWRIKTSNRFLIFWTFDLLWPVPSTRLKIKTKRTWLPETPWHNLGPREFTSCWTSNFMMHLVHGKFKPNGHDKQVIGRWGFHGIMLWTYYI